MRYKLILLLLLALNGIGFGPFARLGSHATFGAPLTETPSWFAAGTGMGKSLRPASGESARIAARAAADVSGEGCPSRH